MPSEPKLYETKIVVSVLSENEPYSFSGYENLAYDVIHGHCSGVIMEEEVVEHDRASFTQRCEDHGTDPTFFLALSDEEF